MPEAQPTLTDLLAAVSAIDKKVDRELHHIKTNREMTQQGLAHVTQKADEGVKKVEEGASWLKTTGSVVGIGVGIVVIVGAVIGIGGFLFARGGSEVALTGRVAVLERDAVGIISLRERVQAVEQAREQGRRLVELQIDDIKNQLRRVEQADATGTGQLNEALRALAAATAESRANAARLDEITRRMERLENLRGQTSPRPGVDEAPAMFIPSPAHT